MTKHHGLTMAALLFASSCIAFTAAETNSVLQRIFSSMEVASGHDNWSVNDGDHDVSGQVTDMTGFLDRIDCPGWGLNDKRLAFDWYLVSLADSNAEDMQARDRQTASLALAFCSDLFYTNAIPSYRRLALNPSGFSRDKAMRLYLKCAGVGSEATAFTETVMTNLQGNSSHERLLTIRTYAAMLQDCLRTGGSIAAEIPMFYRNRNLDPTGAITVDKLLVVGVDGYANSSNRLKTARSMSSVTNMRPSFVEYFVSVTNQLLSSGQPLRQLNIGEAGE